MRHDDMVFASAPWGVLLTSESSSTTLGCSLLQFHCLGSGLKFVARHCTAVWGLLQRLIQQKHRLLVHRVHFLVADDQPAVGGQLVQRLAVPGTDRIYDGFVPMAG